MSIRSCRARTAGSGPTVVAAMSAHLHPDALGLRELIERGLAGVAAVTGLLDAAVGNGRVHHLVRVDPRGADAQRPAGPVGQPKVAGPDAGGQPVLDVVGDAVGLLLRGELEDAHHRAEDLLLGDPHLVAHAREDGRLVEEAALAVARSAQRQLGALVLADAHVTLDALELLGRYDRAHVGIGIEPAGDADPARLLDDPAHDLVVDALVDKHARAARADLPRGAPHSGHRGG